MLYSYIAIAAGGGSTPPRADQRIAAFRNTSQKWIVSVAMISEGVDIKRLRVMVYLPNARTELAFRQAVGRVVRSLGKKDMSSAYVIMPILKTLEKYAQRIENEMSPIARKAPQKPTKKIQNYRKRVLQDHFWMLVHQIYIQKRAADEGIQKWSWRYYLTHVDSCLMFSGVPRSQRFQGSPEFLRCRILTKNISNRTSRNSRNP